MVDGMHVFDTGEQAADPVTPVRVLASRWVRTGGLQLFTIRRFSFFLRYVWGETLDTIGNVFACSPSQSMASQYRSRERGSALAAASVVPMFRRSIRYTTFVQRLRQLLLLLA